MDRNQKRKFSANEKEIAELLNENERWKIAMANVAEEINFLNLFLRADIFGHDAPGLNQKIENYIEQLENLRRDNLEFIREIHNHRYDIEGMNECEDIGCEVFYHNEHLKLGHRIREFKSEFNQFKLKVFSETGKLLKTPENVQQ